MYLFLCTRDKEGGKVRINNVVAVYGLKGSCGVSMIATSITQQLLKGGEKHILYMNLDGTEGGEYFNVSNERTLDEIKNKLKSRTIKTHEILDLCKKLRNKLYYLPGNLDYLNRRQYDPSTIIELIKTLSKQFDLIIIDAGNEVDLSMTVATLMVAQHHYLVLTQQHQVLKRYKALQSYLNELTGPRKIIVNKYIDDPEILTKEQLEAVYEDIVTALPYVDVTKGILAESPGKTLLKEDDQYDKGIQLISKELRKELGWQEAEGETKDTKKGFVNRLFGKGKSA